MSNRLAQNCKLWVAQFEFGLHLTSIKTAIECPPKDNTKFNDTGYETRLAGIPSGSMDLDGYLDFGSSDVQPDDALEGTIFGAANKVATLGHYGGTAGNLAYLVKVHNGMYGWSMQTGEVIPFKASFHAEERLLVGHILDVRAITNAGTTYGTAFEWGAVGAAIPYHGHLHVTYLDCTNVVVKIQSDSNEEFDSPTDRLTFTTATGVTSERKSGTGAVTDTWWRTAVTVTGGNGDATIAVAIGK